jgi:hypothetical protein
MAEPITTIGLGALGAHLGKDVVQKVLGPTADYMGEGLKTLTQKRVENIGRIFKTAESILGEKLETPGEVPPKVLRAVLDEGSFSNANLEAEYLGGILASSRTDQGRDDRGAGIAKTVDSLSTYQLRTHYLIYATVRELFAESGIQFDALGRGKMQVYLPFSGYLPAMEFSEAEVLQIRSLMGHIFWGLNGDNLIDHGWQYGNKEEMVKWYPGATEDGIICTPSSLGVELFLWAFGHADKAPEYVFNPDFSPLVEGLPASIPGACATKE